MSPVSYYMMYRKMVAELAELYGVDHTTLLKEPASNANVLTLMEVIACIQLVMQR